jgi:C4-dicarboxylate-specific signal transduction histidine kinase
MPEEPHPQAPTELPGCDCHENILKDANGDPIFLILPPAIRAKYEERLSGFEQAWNATKDPAYFREANAWAHFHRQPTPRWLFEAGDEVAAGRRTKQHDERYLDAMRHWMRYQTVRAFREAGCTEDEALDKACKELERRRAAVSKYTIKDSYDRIKREFKAKRHGRYKPFLHGRFRTINGRPVE